MRLNLHANATPKIRAYIQASTAPVANGLQANAAKPGRGTASTAIVNLRQCQKPTRMPGISRPSGKTMQIVGGEIFPRHNRCRQRIPQCQWRERITICPLPLIAKMSRIHRDLV